MNNDLGVSPCCTSDSNRLQEPRVPSFALWKIFRLHTTRWYWDISRFSIDSITYFACAIALWHKANARIIATSRALLVPYLCWQLLLKFQQGQNYLYRRIKAACQEFKFYCGVWCITFWYSGMRNHKSSC